MKPECSSVKKLEYRRPVIPPPLSLFPKSQVPDEPLRTGGGVMFLKLTHAKGGSNILLEKQETKEIKDKVKECEDTENLKGKRTLKSMFFQELRGCEKNPIVYNRFSKECYDPNEKLPEEINTSCIVNIK